jgi:hypothetical protein
LRRGRDSYQDKANNARQSQDKRRKSQGNQNTSQDDHKTKQDTQKVATHAKGDPKTKQSQDKKIIKRQSQDNHKKE